ncbi:MAG: hypothetical protein WKF75_18090 [Singulisphaera sp.]
MEPRLVPDAPRFRLSDALVLIGPRPGPAVTRGLAGSELLSVCTSTNVAVATGAGQSTIASTSATEYGPRVALQEAIPRPWPEHTACGDGPHPGE